MAVAYNKLTDNDNFKARSLTLNNYYPYGMLQSARSVSTGAYRFGYQGQEADNKVGGLGEHVDFGARGLNTWTGKFYGIDPLAAKYPSISPYAFVMNNPIINIDKDGREVYYAADGTYLGKIGTDTKVMVVNQADIKQVKRFIKYSVVDVPDCSTTGMEFCLNGANSCSMSLGVDDELLIAFAAVIDKESGGSKGESYTIGSISQNFIDSGGSNDLTTLEDIVFYENSFSYGAKQSVYTAFKKQNHKKQNTKFAVGAAINAIGYSNELPGFKDYSDGANGWDGRDLIKTKIKLRSGKFKFFNNGHRKYTWNTSSKTLLQEYVNTQGGEFPVDLSTWSFKPNINTEKKPGYVISAIKIEGGTLFEKVEGNRGSEKQNQIKFK